MIKFFSFKITKVIHKLKTSNSVSCYNIPTNIIKANVNVLARIKSNLINKSLVLGVFADRLKQAKILPVYKNKDKLDVVIYHPISVLPVISKVYERVFYRRQYEYFSDNILSSSQFGLDQERVLSMLY